MNSRKKTTITDIAKALKLSPASVSRALRGKNDIGEKTRKKVELMSKRMNYHPNKIASSLRSGFTQIIGVLIPSAEHNFFGAVINGIVNAANEKGYDVLIYQSNETQVLEEKGLKAFLSSRVDGILVSIAKDTKTYLHFKDVVKRKIPLSFFDRTIKELGISSVVVDDHKGGFAATEHLIQQGYSRIAHISGPQHITAFSQRLTGYRDALKKYKIPFSKDLVQYGNLTIESGSQAIINLLTLPKPPDAVFAVEDYTALGAIKQLTENKIEIPGDFGVIGFCNDIFGRHITPSLSTVDQQTFSMGQEAFKMIFDKINCQTRKNKKIENKILDPVLVIRDSSRRKK